MRSALAALLIVALAQSLLCFPANALDSSCANSMPIPLVDPTKIPTENAIEKDLYREQLRSLNLKYIRRTPEIRIAVRKLEACQSKRPHVIAPRCPCGHHVYLGDLLDEPKTESLTSSEILQLLGTVHKGTDRLETFLKPYFNAVVNSPPSGFSSDMMMNRNQLVALCGRKSVNEMDRALQLYLHDKSVDSKCD